MEVQQVLCMNGGDGETRYASNSLFQVSLSLSVSLSLYQFISVPEEIEWILFLVAEKGDIGGEAHAGRKHHRAILHHLP